ncbi:unnamed protein product [Ectocarpus sp. CCAP 1310/34]|nr:unnamed protein product [Ectocarpus sp. CCAP 1310/34]
MKVKTISRVEESYTRDCKGDRLQVHRNRDPSLHPFEKAREYTRALQSVKLDKMFAKPLVGALDGHGDGVFCSASSRRNLVQFLSGACDGEIRLWDLSRRSCVWRAVGHQGFVRGLSVTPDGASFLSAGDDGMVKQWELGVASDLSETPEPTATWMGKSGGFKSLDHHWTDAKFATAGDSVDLWDHSRAEPTLSYQWGADSNNCVRFNPAERCLLASTGSSREVCLYDTRATVPMRKVVLQMRSNAVAWNPQEPMNFVCANEDTNLYTFDLRNLNQALMIHKDHVSAVMDVSFSPTGQEFASGSYDRTVRVFPHRAGRSREVYHTKRMQRVFCVNFSADARFVMTGSDDTNLRIWKANASEKLGKVVPREARKQEYRNSLKKRYEHMPEVRRIAKHRHVPRIVKKAAEAERVQRDKERRKVDNRIKHSKAGTVETVPERKKKIVKELT